MTALTLTLMFNTMSAQFDLPKGLLSSLCFIESSHRVSAVHPDDGSEDSLGICQVHFTTAKDLGFKGTKKQLMKPEVNIYYAAKYLSKQRKRYNGSLPKAIVAYNVGHYVGQDTEYSKKVLKQWTESKRKKV